MAHPSATHRLATPVDPEREHIRGPVDAPVTVVEYGDYECPHCREVEPILADLRERIGDQYRYVYRHFPLSASHASAQLAAEAAEAAGAQGKFWEMHQRLTNVTDPRMLGREYLLDYAREIGLDVEQFQHDLARGTYEAYVEEDFQSGLESGVSGTPTFFINGKRYDGAWDVDSLQEAIEQPLGTRIRRRFRDFARIEASGGILLIIAAIIALVWANSPWSDLYFEILDTEFALELGSWHLGMHLLHWINDGLMAIFFFVVGLEIKREVLAGELSQPRKAILPLMAGVGGMLFPAALYTLVNAGGDGASGWGIPMATDIAFMLGVLALLGSRIPTSLKIFFTALAIADDLGAVMVIAVFYSDGIYWLPLAVAAGLFVVLMVFNRTKVYHPLPYALVGIGLWYAFLMSGVHATLAGVLLAMTIPARTTVNASAFVAQATAILQEFEGAAVMQLGMQGGHRQEAVQTLEIIAERLESPLQRLERTLHPWTTYVVVPIFALANAGVDLRGDLLGALLSPISLGIMLGLVVGKSTGIMLLSWLTVRLGLADLPDGVSWRQLFSTSWLAGIGFTMSLFIAGTEFAGGALEASKVGILAASLLSGVIGTLLTLVFAPSHRGVTEFEPEPEPVPAD